MPSVIAKKKGNKLYYYVVESARVEGQPRIVHQAYLGTAEKLAEMVRDRTAPLPLAAGTREFGLPAALWSAAERTGVWELLQSLWPVPRSGPSAGHYLLLAAMHRICQPGPKTEVADWYRNSILSALWGFPPERFTAQAFWDAFEQILPEEQAAVASEQDPLDQAQLRLLGLWKEKQPTAEPHGRTRGLRLLFRLDSRAEAAQDLAASRVSATGGRRGGGAARVVDALQSRCAFTHRCRQDPS